VGDIRELRLENVRWQEGRLEITQAKTGRPLVLPLADEVAGALIDYLRHGRPASSARHIFLKCRAPFEPFAQNNNLNNIITLYQVRSAFEALPGMRRGMHSLRHTVATRLLEEGAALETIASVLGHASTAATAIYTKVDVEALRGVGLDPLEGSHA